MEWSLGDGRKLVVLSCDPGRREWNTVMGPMKDPVPKGSTKLKLECKDVTDLHYCMAGQLWIVDPTSNDVVGVPCGLKNFPGDKTDFHPLGLDIISTSEGDMLHVVNHQRGETTIEVFRLTLADSRANRAIAHWKATLSHPAFTGTPNSIAVLSPHAFYLSHDHYFSRRDPGVLPALMNRLETFAALPLGRVDIVGIQPGAAPGSGQSIGVATAASGIAFANGLALSHDRKTLAVASTTHRQIHFYDVNPTTYALILREKIALPFLVDNLSLAPKSWSPAGGDVFIAAGHPHFFSLAAEASGKILGPNNTHPSSWVVAIKPRGASDGDDDDLAAPFPTSMIAKRSEKWALTTLFQSKGGKEEGAFGMSTTGVGGVLEDGRKWLVVVGLYAEGARLLREI